MSEIEKYYNGEIHVDFEEKTKENDFGKAVEFIVESDFNKDLNKCLDIVKELDKKDKEIERLKSIIKEVREYIENGNYRFREGTDICLYQEGNEVFYMENDELMARKILSILDKENK